MKGLTHTIGIMMLALGMIGLAQVLSLAPMMGDYAHQPTWFTSLAILATGSLVYNIPALFGED